MLFQQLDDSTSDAPFELAVADLALGPIAVLAFAGKEKLSHVYALDLEVDLQVETDVVHQLVGRRALLALRHDRVVSRVIGGVVTRARATAGRTSGGLIRARLRLEPAFARLRERRSSRIFQDCRIRQVIETVLADHGVRHTWTSTTDRHVEVHPYVVQYEETDRGFVERLLAEAGMIHWFEAHHGDGDGEAEARGAEVMVIADAAEDYAKRRAPHAPDAPATLAHRRATGNATGDDALTDFSVEARAGTTSAALWQWDFQRPVLDVRAAHPPRGADPLRESFEGAATSMLAEVDDARARRVLEARTRPVRGRGASTARWLRPGLVVDVVDELEPSLGGGWVVQSVTHRGDAQRATVYEAEVAFAPAATAVRPRIPRRRVLQIAETAIVTGPPGEPIHTDAYGRIKVRFEWDRFGPHDDGSSAWLRVSQPWAGAGFGVAAIPRVGSEVLVTFLGGDPDRPVVTGGLHNRIAMPPFPLPAQRTKSGLRSQSLGGGWNELSFDDAAGTERVHLRAERELDTWVGGKSERQVALDDVSTVGGVQSVRVALDQSTTVGGGRTVNVAESQSITVGADERVRVAGSSQLVVDGARVVSTDGPIQLQAGAGLTARSDGDLSLSAGGDVKIDAGQDDKGRVTVTGAAGVRIESPKRIVIEALEGVELVSGAARLVLTPELIELVAEIHLLGEKSTFVAGSKDALELGDGAQVRAKEVLLLAEGSSLELGGSAAKLGGSQIELGAAEDGEDEDADKEDPELKRLRFRFVEHDGKPFRDRTVHVVAAGERQQTTTDGDGWLSLKVRKEADRADVRMWTDTYPTGPQRRWDLLLVEELPGADTPEGARARLHALGYDVGLYAADPWPVFEFAVRSFQEKHRTSHALEPTGELDADTTRVLREVHGA